MEIVVSIIVIAIIVILVAWAIGSYLSRQIDIGNDPDEPEVNDSGTDEGSPLFRAHRNALGKLCPLDDANIGDLAVVPCRFGVLE